jgi:hypothetical protein
MSIVANDGRHGRKWLGNWPFLLPGDRLIDRYDGTLGDIADRSSKLVSRRSLNEGHPELRCRKTLQARGLVAAEW